MKYLLPAIALPLAAIASTTLAQTPEEIAKAALEQAPVWDGHNDVPIQLRERLGNKLEHFDFEDTSEVPASSWSSSTSMHTDLPRLRRGHVGAQFWSVFVTTSITEPEAVRQTLEQIDVTKRLVARYPDQMTLCLDAECVEKAMKSGKIASLMGMEGGHSIGSSLGVLRQMHVLGARYMTLTHSKNTPWADSATDKPLHGGLTDFGKDVVREMNRLGMIVDLSHVSEAVMMDALDVAKAPVMFSHSGARAINGHSRNVSDTVLARVRDNGGIVMAVALPGYVSETQRQWFANRKAEQARLESLWQGQPEAVAAALGQWDEANPTPLATVSELADHIDHIREVAGIDHIGIGGDYDGMATGPEGMEDVSGYPELFVELAHRGYSKADLAKISSGNMLRVMKAVEAYAAAHRMDAPIESSLGKAD